MCVREVALHDKGEVSKANKEFNVHEFASNLHHGAVDELSQNANLYTFADQ